MNTNLENLYQKKYLSNTNKMLQDAKEGKYAVAHFNFKSINEIKAILRATNKVNKPVILAITENALNNCLELDYGDVVSIINTLIIKNKIAVDVALHLDHCQNVDEVIKAIKSGFSSVMYDGSHLPFEENYKNTKLIVDVAKKYNVSVEAEIGKIGGKEDNISNDFGEYGSPKEAQEMSKLGITMLAAGIGNIHGIYPKDWKGLNFNILKEIKESTNLPLVMHGGSGIPFDQVKKAIKMGICKFNVGTQIQITQNKALRNYYETNQDYKNKKGYDINQIMKKTIIAIENQVIELTNLFNSNSIN